MRSRSVAWQELSKLCREYSGVSDEDGDELFAKAAGISLYTATFMRKPGVGNMPPKGEVLIGIAHLAKIAPDLSVDNHGRMLDLVNECYRSARRQTARLGIRDSMYHRSR